MTRFVRTTLAVLLALTLASAVGCTGKTAAPEGGAAGTVPANVEPAPIRIGTLPTEDSLPLWVAEKEGLFEKAGLKVTITSFASAQERDAALSAGAIDGFMGDLIAAATLRAGGIPVRVTTVMLGATPQEGRFGIALKPKSTITDLKQLAGKPIGTSSATIQEYVLDSLMGEAGIPRAQIKKQETKKVPIRFELLMQGKLEAAALPEPFLSLAEKQGAKVIAADTTGENLTQTVLVVSEKYLDKAEGTEAMTALLGVWDDAVGRINKDPNAYRSLLVEKARLPKPLESSYQVNTYPTAQLPKDEQITDVLDWMASTGLLKVKMTPQDLTWSAAAK